MTNNQRVTRSMAAKARTSKSDPKMLEVDGKSSIWATRWNFIMGIATVVLVALCTVRYTMNREIVHLDKAIKSMDQEYFKNLTMELSQMYSQMRTSAIPGLMSPAPASRGARIDHAQFQQGAKIIRFSGEEMANPNSYGDRMKQALGFYVPKGACLILGKRLNKNKFLTFKGDRAKILVELNQAIFLDTFKIEHFIANPNDTTAIGMMPKNVIVHGLRKSSNLPIILGQVKVPLNTNSNIQSGVLQINEPRESFEWFQVEVLNNHGHKDLTKIYKIRMYGEIDDTK